MSRRPRGGGNRGAARTPVVALLATLAVTLLGGGAALGGTEPEPDAPPSGRSLFDQLFEREVDGRREVRPPFPFEALLARLDIFAGRDDAGRSRLKQVLIPHGRSLERHAARPDYLDRPRIVVAVDTAAAPVPGRAWHWLKDRLFIGYQSATAALEVISYNERAGRFEFQVVSDYRADTTPHVRYASRRLCVACHHNRGPIFAEEPWSETHANPALRAALGAHARAAVRGRLDDGATAAGAFDNATDRASLLPIYDLGWRELCGGRPMDGFLRCRGGAVIAALHARMGPFVGFAPGAALYVEHFGPHAERRWQQRWPHGLPIPNPDLPDRNPARIADPSRIEPAHDPLRPRPEPARWQLPSGLNRVVIGWAESLPDPELARLDRELRRRSRAAGLVPRRFAGPCHGHAGGARCALADPDTGEEIQLLLAAQSVDTRVRSLTAYDGTRFHAVETLARRTEVGTGLVVLQLAQRGRGLGLRLGDGSRIDEVRVPSPTTGKPRGEASVLVVQDFRFLEQAVEDLIGEARTAPDHPLRSATFRPRHLLNALARHLGLPPTPWCCDDDDAAVPITLAETSLAGAAPVPGPWQRHCAGCHDQPGSHPPAFLRGSRPEIARRLAACAPLIVLRLGLWRVPPEQRPVSAMPPVAALASAGIDSTRWSAHPDFARLEREALALARDPAVTACR